jgi:RNA polymerase sigma-70 factor (ECF subfamily)
VAAEPPRDLLEQFARGDPHAVEALYRAYTPYLRAVVRRLLSDRLRSKFDSADVVQSVWVQVVGQLGRAGWRVDNENQLRALLTTIARRRLVTRARRHSHAPVEQAPERHEWEGVPEAGLPRPSEVVQADELWDRMLRLCPPEHHPVLVLRRQGLRLAEIASRTGLHEGSVRRILRQLSRELAIRNEPFPEAGDDTRSDG